VLLGSLTSLGYERRSSYETFAAPIHGDKTDGDDGDGGSWRWWRWW
jgi:hypothetical protein